MLKNQTTRWLLLIAGASLPLLMGGTAAAQPAAANPLAKLRQALNDLKQSVAITIKKPPPPPGKTLLPSEPPPPVHKPVKGPKKTVKDPTEAVKDPTAAVKDVLHITDSLCRPQGLTIMRCDPLGEPYDPKRPHGRTVRQEIFDELGKYLSWLADLDSRHGGEEQEALLESVFIAMGSDVAQVLNTAQRLLTDAGITPQERDPEAIQKLLGRLDSLSKDEALLAQLALDAVLRRQQSLHRLHQMDRTGKIAVVVLDAQGNEATTEPGCGPYLRQVLLDELRRDLFQAHQIIPDLLSIGPNPDSTLRVVSQIVMGASAAGPKNPQQECDALATLQRLNGYKLDLLVAVHYLGEEMAPVMRLAYPKVGLQDRIVVEKPLGACGSEQQKREFQRKVKQQLLTPVLRSLGAGSSISQAIRDHVRVIRAVLLSPGIEFIGYEGDSTIPMTRHPGVVCIRQDTGASTHWPSLEALQKALPRWIEGISQVRACRTAETDPEEDQAVLERVPEEGPYQGRKLLKFRLRYGYPGWSRPIELPWVKLRIQDAPNAPPEDRVADMIAGTLAGTLEPFEASRSVPRTTPVPASPRVAPRPATWSAAAGVVPGIPLLAMPSLDQRWFRVSQGVAILAALGLGGGLIYSETQRQAAAFGSDGPDRTREQQFYELNIGLGVGLAAVSAVSVALTYGALRQKRR